MHPYPRLRKQVDLFNVDANLLLIMIPLILTVAFTVLLIGTALDLWPDVGSARSLVPID